jgi:hypothetical protein
VVLALNPDYPLLDLFWTMLMIGAFGLLLWTLIVVFRDLYGRSDVSTGGKVGWTLLVLVLPIIGSLAYLISQSASMAERAWQRDSASEVRLDDYTRSVTGRGGYHNIHETVTGREALAGPTRQDSA